MRKGKMVISLSPRVVLIGLGMAVMVGMVVMHQADNGLGGPTALLTTPGTENLEQKIAHLQAESAQIETVRLRAESLNRRIESIERRGKSGAEDSASLAKEAAQLKARLFALASDAHLDPETVLKDYPTATRHHYLDDERHDWPKQAHTHRYIDDDSVGHSSSHNSHYIDDDSRELESHKVRARAGFNVGVLGRTPERTAGRGRRHYHDDDSWEAAPTLNKWGEQKQGQAGAKEAIEYYDYGNPTKLRPWAYGPTESAVGADFQRGVKGQKDISFGNSWNKVKDDASWQVAPKGDSLLNEVRSSSSNSIAKPVVSSPQTESKAWAKAQQWFDHMREKTASQVDAKIEQRHFGSAENRDGGLEPGQDSEEVKQEVRKQVEARMRHFSKFDRSVSSRVANDLKVLQEARSAEAALRREAAANAQVAAVKTVADIAPSTVAPMAQVPAVGDLERDGALKRTEGMLNALVGDADSKYGSEETSVETAAQREQAGWEAATEQAAEPASRATAVVQQKPAVSSETARAEATTMHSQLQKARAEVGMLPPSERAAAQAAIKAMEGALKGARVSANALERNKKQMRSMGKAASAASEQVSSLESDPVVRQAEEAQQRVLRLQQQLQTVKSGKDNRLQLHIADARQQIHKRVMQEAAQAAARGAQIKASTSEAGSRLAKLGINTGEGGWGDNKLPTDKYEPGLSNM